MIVIEHLEKKYKGTDKGIKDISLHVEKGDLFAFIGHNGAGKTTLLKCITGIHDFDKGKIMIDGTDLEQNPMECKRKFAYIPDNPDLYEYLTGIQYLNFIGDVFQVNAKDRKERIEKYGQALEIMSDLEELIKSYSHGMKQKLAILSALIH
ncbi:MAG: ABC transporter ATP-binding protein, partial [Lachnospiraceae bacterium]|nr:ABC transporter ATP-binding protein [Lachnospiraceae bacterium]